MVLAFSTAVDGGSLPAFAWAMPTFSCLYGGSFDNRRPVDGSSSGCENDFYVVRRGHRTNPSRVDRDTRTLVARTRNTNRFSCSRPDDSAPQLRVISHREPSDRVQAGKNFGGHPGV